MNIISWQHAGIHYSGGGPNYKAAEETEVLLELINLMDTQRQTKADKVDVMLKCLFSPKYKHRHTVAVHISAPLNPACVLQWKFLLWVSPKGATTH